MNIKHALLLTGCILLSYIVKSQANEVHPLKIGDKVPDVVIKLSNYGKPDARLSDFKGKHIILDFWATWCSPCVAFFRTTDSLEKRFGDKVVILPVTYEDVGKVSSFLTKLGKSYGIKTPFSVVNDSVLHKAFPHNTVPHEVWIDDQGTVKAITTHLEVNTANIQAFVKGETFSLPVKFEEREIQIEYDKPVLVGPQNINIENELVYNSVLTRFKAGLPSIFKPGNREKPFLTCLNIQIKRLYQLAYGEFMAELGYNARTIVELQDTALVDYPRAWFDDQIKWGNWQQDHTFCYELTIKDTSLYKDRFKIMQADLNNYFGPKYGIEGRKEKRKVKCWVLTKTSPVDKLTSAGGEPEMTADAFGLKIRNMKFINFMSKLWYFFQEYPIPLYDDTGYSLTPVDMDINCNLSNLDSVNEALSKYDLKFVQQERVLDMIVISEKK